MTTLVTHSLSTSHRDVYKFHHIMIISPNKKTISKSRLCIVALRVLDSWSVDLWIMLSLIIVCLLCANVVILLFYIFFANFTPLYIWISNLSVRGTQFWNISLEIFYRLLSISCLQLVPWKLGYALIFMQLAYFRKHLS